MRGGKTKKSPRSVMGKLLPPVDIRDVNELNELDKRIQVGPITLVLVYADWCGHCQHYKPIMEKLENLPNRSVQTARIREDVFPKSSINGAKIEGYPSLLLVKPNGQVESFKNESGKVTNAIPNHTDESQMKSIVRTAGLPEGQEILNEKPSSNALGSSGNNSITTPSNILADRLPNETVVANNAQMANSKNKLLQTYVNKTSQNKLITGGGACGTESCNIVLQQQGGGLWNSLYQVSNRLAPAAALFLGASYITRRKSRKQGRKASSRKASRGKTTRRR